MSLTNVVGLVAGFVCLLGGAELLVRGAASIASRFGIPPVIVGLTVVALGTSAPELAVSIGSSLSGDSEIGLGNVLGSNIANVLLILGSAAAVAGLAVSQRLIRLDIPVMIGVTIVFFLMALDHSIGRLDGVVLVAGLVAYLTWVVRAARRERPEVLAEYDREVTTLEGTTAASRPGIQILFLVAGAGVLVVGAELLVGAATDIAVDLGVSDLVIGLTVVAIGTSLPELATSLTAARRGERDIAVGKVVGSNLFNLLAVAGTTAVVSSDGIVVSDAALRLDFPVMLAATLVLLPICWNGFRIARWEGVVLLVAYAVYLTYLVLDSSDHTGADVLAPIALVAAPLVVLTFTVTGVQGWRRSRRTSSGDPLSAA